MLYFNNIATIKGALNIIVKTFIIRNISYIIVSLFIVYLKPIIVKVYNMSIGL
jgi:hypothetical protein